MRRTARVRMAALTLGALMVGTCVVSLEVKTLEAQPTVVGHMSLDDLAARRALHVLEDDARWDCRIDGNMQCGAPDNAAYALLCADYTLTSAACAIERWPFQD